MKERGHLDVGAYYDQKLVSIAEATGAGLIWFMGRDHLSPPLSNADEYALDSNRWREACSMRVVDLARRMGIKASNLVVELGCGIGGPGRDVVEATGAKVVGLSVSFSQLQNLRHLSKETGSTYDDVIVGDMQKLPVKEKGVDHIYSINAVYHVNNPMAVISESYRILKKNGCFAIDDWFTTDKTNASQLAQLRHNWSTSSNGFHNFADFKQRMQNVGFKLVEEKDFTEEAAAFLTEERFGATYDNQVAPVLLEAFPQLYQYEGYEPAHAEMAILQLRSDILYMGDLYRSGSAVYRQIIVEK